MNILEAVPSSTEGALKYLGLNKDSSFITYVVCPNCDSIYTFDDCVTSSGMTMESKHIAYPNHPHASRRKECGGLLLRKVKSGKSFELIPIKAYPYQPLRTSLGRLVKREGFVQACEQWRQRQTHIPPGYYGDVFDGQIWNEFGASSNTSFLSSPYCYMLTINVDWFQPFVHTEYSLGAIYLTIQNLPRELRYKEENVLLVGLLPGPSEPYLSPLVAELNEAWVNGITLKTVDGTNFSSGINMCEL